MNKDSKLKLNSGNMIPVIGLGTWQLKPDTAEKISYALQLDYPLIDTSGDYGTQPGISRGIEESDKSPDEVYIVSKVEEDDPNTYETVKKFNSILNTESIDLMLIHRPPKKGVGENLWQGLVKAKKEGLTKDIGVSNYSVEQIGELVRKTGTIPAINQIEWSPFGHSVEMKKYCDEENILIMAYSPLTRGKKLKNKTLQEIAEKYEKSTAQIIIRWNLQKKVIPIPKSDDKNHLKENINVFDFEIDQKDMQKLNELNTHFSSLGKTLEYL